MLVSWWHQTKSKAITAVIKILRLETMNVSIHVTNFMTVCNGYSSKTLIFSSIHQVWFKDSARVSADTLLYSHVFQLPLGDPEAFLDQMRIISFPAWSGSIPWSPNNWTCPEDLQRVVPRMHPNQIPKSRQWASFNPELYSKTFPNVKAT